MFRSRELLPLPAFHRALVAATALAVLGSATSAAAATFTVTNLNDSGAGSLRGAILSANGSAGVDTITVTPGLDGQITLLSDLTITEAVNIDLTTTGNAIIPTGAVGVGIGSGGVVTMNGIYNITGSTTLTTGTLQVGAFAGTTGFNLGMNRSLFVQSAGTLLDIPVDRSVIFESISGAGSIQLGGTTSELALSNQSDQTYNGAITGTGFVVLDGNGGNLTLTGANTYSGTTSLFALLGTITTPPVFRATLTAGSTTAFSPNSAFVLLGNANLVLNGFDQTIASLEGSGLPTVSLGSARLTMGGNNTSTTYLGSITGTGGLTKNGNGTFSLNGSFGATITYTGATLVNAGSFKALSTGAFAPGSAYTIANGATLDLNGFNQTIAALTGSAGSFVTLGTGTLTVGNASDTLFAGAISGSGGLTKVGTGIMQVSGANTYAGPTNVIQGGLQLIAANVLPSASAVTIGVDGIISSSLNNQTFGSLAGAGVLVLPGSVITVGGNNSSTTFSGFLSLNGQLAKTGTGTMTLTGNNASWAGSTMVNGGKLIQNGSTALSATTVGLAGTLGGTGSVGTTTVNGTLAPGNSIGTINTGAITFNAGSTYEVEVNAAGQSDKTLVAGTATITGGTVQVLATPGAYAQSTQYTILTSAGVLTGQFAGVTSNFAFLSPSLGYDANNVFLTLTRNSTAVATLGQTPNQMAAGAGLDSAQLNAPYLAQFLGLSAAQVPGALDQLSGEAHASIKGVMVDDSTIREAALDRVDQAFAALEASGAMSQFVATEVATSESDKASQLLWGHLYGKIGVINANGNAAETRSNTGGVLFGTEGDFGNWKIGVLAGAGLTSISARNTTATSGDFSLGVYGGTEVGDGVLFKVGAALTGHAISTTRTITLPGGIADTARASYSAATAQVFGEISKTFDVGAVALTPFAQLALITHMTSAFTETGAPGAISSAATSTSAAFATLGFRADHQFVLGDAMLVTASGSLGWRHAFADLPASVNCFVAGGPFTVTGAANGPDALVLSAGLDFDISDDLNLKLGYDGALAPGGASHSIKLTLAGHF